MPNYEGYLDICLQSRVAGWAVADDEPATVSVYINDVLVGTIACDQERADVAAVGRPIKSGFIFWFKEPLGHEDIVDVRFLGGPPLANSPSRDHLNRMRKVTYGILPDERGLEFGALDKPTLYKSQYNVRYVDHANPDELRRKYKGHEANVTMTLVQEVDYVWSGSLLKVVVGDGWDYCLASHVIEHIADPIGWLAELTSILNKCGRINLAVPEQTRTFDYRRSLTTPAQLLDAWMRKLDRPSFGQIFDHCVGIHHPGSPEPDAIMRTKEAFRIARAAECSGTYMDVHCHVWTYHSFLFCWEVISRLDILPLRLDASWPAEGKQGEFIVSLVRE